MQNTTASSSCQLLVKLIAVSVAEKYSVLRREQPVQRIEGASCREEQSLVMDKSRGSRVWHYSVTRRVKQTGRQN
jgi:hypothetical protein